MISAISLMDESHLSKSSNFEGNHTNKTPLKVADILIVNTKSNYASCAPASLPLIITITKLE